jgi:4-oxalocrotonate tautomerase
MSIVHHKEEAISVAFEEVEAQDWTQKVYKPEIQEKWDKVYKKPGYNPLRNEHTE